jgi:hypothetical protein
MSRIIGGFLIKCRSISYLSGLGRAILVDHISHIRNRHRIPYEIFQVRTSYMACHIFCIDESIDINDPIYNSL